MTTTCEPAASPSPVALELEDIHTRLPEWAAAHGLHLIPAEPQGRTLTCELEPETVGAEEFCALAARAQATFLYWTTDTFDANHLQDTDDEDDVEEPLTPEDRTLLRRLLHTAKQEHGRLTELTLTFIVEGVRHQWTLTAPWYDELETQFEDLEEKYEEEEEKPAEDPPVTKEEVDRLATVLHALPTFRAAKSNAERERIALRQLPELLSVRHHGTSRLGYQAIEEATFRVEEAARTLYTDYHQRLPELAQQIHDSGALDQAPTAPARKARIREYILEHTGGYPPTKDFIETLYAQPLLKKPTRHAAATSPAALWSDL